MHTVQGRVCTPGRRWNQFLREVSETGGETGGGVEAEESWLTHPSCESGGDQRVNSHGILFSATSMTHTSIITHDTKPHKLPH